MIRTHLERFTGHCVSSNGEGDAATHGQVQEVEASVWEEQSTQNTKSPNKKLNSTVVFPYMKCWSTMDDAFLKERSGQNVKTLSQLVFQQQLATFLKVNCEVSNIFLFRVKWTSDSPTPAGMGEEAKDRSGRISLSLGFAIQKGWRKDPDWGLIYLMVGSPQFLKTCPTPSHTLSFAYRAYVASRWCRRWTKRSYNGGGVSKLVATE